MRLSPLGLRRCFSPKFFSNKIKLRGVVQLVCKRNFMTPN